MAIIITRPKASAALTAQFLQESLGQDFTDKLYILPLSQIIPLKIQQKTFDADYILASSAAAFKYLPAIIIEKIKDLPLYVIGKKTAKAALHYGMKNIVAIYENGQDFINNIKIAAKSSILYILGKRHIEEFIEKLQNKFINIHLLEVYETKPIFLSAKDLAKIPKNLQIILLYSALAAENIGQLHNYIDKNTVLLCLSSRIAKAIPKNIAGKIIIAAKPNEQSMLNALCHIKK